jgi:putative transposase
MRNQRYPSDLTDAQWALIKPFIPVYPGGRPRKTAMPDVLDAILYLLGTGCQWRYLPNDFPPKSTVWGYFNRWRHNGTLDRIHDALRDRVRKKEKPQHPRRTASIDSHSVGKKRCTVECQVPSAVMTAGRGLLRGRFPLV